MKHINLILTLSFKPLAGIEGIATNYTLLLEVKKMNSFKPLAGIEGIATLWLQVKKLTWHTGFKPLAGIEEIAHTTADR